MTKIILKIPLIIVASLFVGCQGLFKQSCTGGHRHGYNVDFTRYWYFCNDGTLENRGCFASNRKRLPIGQKYVDGNFEVECKEIDGNLKLDFIGCVVGNSSYAPDQVWQGKDLDWYKCVLERDSIRAMLMGCVREDGQSMYLGDEHTKDDVVYRCQESMTRTVELSPISCIHGGERYRIGEIFQDRKFWYSCTQDWDEVGKKELMGCIHFDQRIRAGDRYIVNQVVYECQLHPTPQHKVHGCVRITADGSFDYVELNTTWLEGERPRRFQIQCQENVTQHIAFAKATSCILTDSSGKYEEDRSLVIEPGCFTVLKKKAIACISSKEGDLTFKTFPSNSLYNAFALNVRYCIPGSL